MKNELEQLKAQHGKVYEAKIYLDDDDESKVATIFVKKMDRKTMQMVKSLIKGGDSFKAVEACLRALYVGGDKLELVTGSDDALLSAEALVVDLLERKPAELKKN